MLTHCDRKLQPPLTVNETAQLLHAWSERETLRGEREVLVRLLLEADKVVSTIEGECQEEWDQLADLRRAIAAATIPHRPEEADLLSLRACLGA